MVGYVTIAVPKQLECTIHRTIGTSEHWSSGTLLYWGALVLHYPSVPGFCCSVAPVVLCSGMIPMVQCYSGVPAFKRFCNTGSLE